MGMSSQNTFVLRIHEKQRIEDAGNGNRSNQKQDVVMIQIKFNSQLKKEKQLYQIRNLNVSARKKFDLPDVCR
jgi:hypothetical protein